MGTLPSNDSGHLCCCFQAEPPGNEEPTRFRAVLKTSDGRDGNQQRMAEEKSSESLMVPSSMGVLGVVGAVGKVVFG